MPYLSMAALQLELCVEDLAGDAALVAERVEQRLLELGALSIVGLPPFGGTWSKWWLVQGTLDTGAWMLTAVLLISSLLNIAYLLTIPMRARKKITTGSSKIRPKASSNLLERDR